MASENNTGFRSLMSEGLKSITDKMVFEGVTPKSGMKKVKAMKRLWRSDSFQMMKSILEEPPIQEGRVRPPLLPSPDQDDLDDLAETEASPRDTNLAKEAKEKELEYQRRKEELGAQFKNSLEEDLFALQEKADDIVNKLLDDTRMIVQQSEEEQIESIIKKRIVAMKNSIKCYKKHRNKVLKITVEEDRKQVIDELKDFLERDIEIRLKTYRQLLEKIYNYKIRQFEDFLSDEHDDKIREKIRSSTNKFNVAKDRLSKRQDRDLKLLECKLSAEFAEHEKWSENRIESMLEDALFELQDQEDEDDKIEKSECSIADGLLLKLNKDGWLPERASKNDDWESLVADLLRRYQFLVELTLKDMGTQQNQYFLSMDRLKYFKDRISKINQRKLTETHDVKTRQKNRFKAKLRAASVLDHLIRQALLSPPPSRVSIEDLNLKPRTLCRPRITTLHDKKFTALSFRGSKIETRASHKMTVSAKTNLEQNQLHMYSEEDRNNFIITMRENPKLYNVFFYGL